MKKILFIGGSGRVGAMTLPILRDAMQATVFDLNPPQVEGVEYIQGSVNDYAALRDAVRDRDAVVYMAMVPEKILNDVPLSYDINCKGIHLTLAAAHDEGIGRVVFFSSGSATDGNDFPQYDEMPLCSNSPYGMTKGLGEHICEWFCAHHDMSIIALRLWFPTTRERWDEWREKHGKVTHWMRIATHDDDLARAMLSAIDSNVQDFQAMLISGDLTGEHIRTDRAREILGWEPKSWE